MEQTEHKTSGLLRVVAKVLNTGGSLMVKTYDITADIAGKAAGTLITAPGEILGRTKDVLVGGYEKIFKSNEKAEMKAKIREYEEKIKRLYFEIGKEGSSAEKLESEKVKDLINKVREYEQEIKRLKASITEMPELEALRKEEVKKAKAAPVRKKIKVPDEQAVKAIRAAIEKAVKQGEFYSGSEREIFKKIATDLLDDEMDVKILAAAELGKMGIKPAVDILAEAVKFDNMYLNAEIINSLTNIGDARALSLCKEMAKGPNHRLRVSCLRGLYKMGADEEIASYLIEALNDEHPEVRRTSATFLGWKDIADATPGLIQSLQDRDESVRKAAVTALNNIKDNSAVLPMMRALGDESVEIRQKALDALRNITGEEISFNIELKGKELTAALNGLKEWWQSERISKIGESIAPESAPEEPAAAETTEAVAQEDLKEEEVKEEDLRRKLKSEIISLCQSRGIECDETSTKAEMINMLMKGK